MEEIIVRPITQSDISSLVTAYNEPPGGKFEEHIRKIYNENPEKRITFIALYKGSPAGYVSLIYKSRYPYFNDNNIPEINELEVLETCRRRGIGRALLTACESLAKDLGYGRVGLGVGLYKDYGSAQRLNTKNGYVFDGKGLMYNNAPVPPGTHTFVDDELLLYMVKEV